MNSITPVTELNRDSKPTTVRSAIFGGVVSSLDESAANRVQSGEGARCRAFVETSGNLSTHVTRGDVRLDLRGYAVHKGRGLSTTRQVAEFMLDQFFAGQRIPFREFDGSFVVIITNTGTGHVSMFRNLAGTTNVFYRQEGSQFHFATNLVDLVESADHLALRDDLLPTYFLFRCIPGRDTLFDGCFRLMPGELVTFRDGCLERQREMTFADLVAGSPRPFRDREDLLEALAQTLADVVRDCVRSGSQSGVMLSGGVDSTLVQSFWNDFQDAGGPKRSYCVTVDHDRTLEEFQYANSAADQLGVELVGVSADLPYAKYLRDVIDATAETPNHVQAAYFPELAQVMVDDGAPTGLSGEAGDGIFGVGTAYDLQLAEDLRRRFRSRQLCRVLSAGCVLPRLQRLKQHLHNAARIDNKADFAHPINRQASFTHLPAVVRSFGERAVSEALQNRRDLIRENRLSGSLVAELHAANLLTSSINSGSYWNTLFETRGGQVLNPFLDSRVLRFAMNLEETERFQKKNPKRLLKQCLARRGHQHLATRPKLGFGQPIFEWLSPNGQLREMVDAIQPAGFIDEKQLAQCKQSPNWFLYSLLCLDVLKKRFNLD